jgi:hypothetical protein
VSDGNHMVRRKGDCLCMYSIVMRKERADRQEMDAVFSVRLTYSHSSALSLFLRNIQTNGVTHKDHMRVQVLQHDNKIQEVSFH